jgi:hypothetical protein
VEHVDVLRPQIRHNIALQARISRIGLQRDWARTHR